MTEIYLIDEDYIKTNSALNKNVWGDYLHPAIIEAQEISLKPILGCLYDTLIGMIDEETIEEAENILYKTLIDEFIQKYLMYQTIVNLVPVIGVKLDNLGAIMSNDEHTQNISEAERNRIKDYYQFRADFYCRRMQEFVKEHKDVFGDCPCTKSNLESAATTGLWLGGIRGKK